MPSGRVFTGHKNFVCTPECVFIPLLLFAIEFVFVFQVSEDVMSFCQHVFKCNFITCIRLPKQKRTPDLQCKRTSKIHMFPQHPYPRMDSLISIHIQSPKAPIVAYAKGMSIIPKENGVQPTSWDLSTVNQAEFPPTNGALKINGAQPGCIRNLAPRMGCCTLASWVRIHPLDHALPGFQQNEDSTFRPQFYQQQTWE